MKYMLIMRATDEAHAAFKDVDFNEIIESMGRFNDQMILAGVLVAAEGLDDASQGVVVDYSSEPPVVTDGPYGETKELFGGFWILDVASREEAVEWAKRAPMSGPGMKTEIRRVTSIDEFPQDNEWIQKERASQLARERSSGPSLPAGCVVLRLDRYYGRLRLPPGAPPASRLLTGYRARPSAGTASPLRPGRASPVPAVTF